LGLLEFVQDDFEVAVGRDVLDLSRMGAGRGRKKADEQ